MPPRWFPEATFLTFFAKIAGHFSQGGFGSCKTFFFGPGGSPRALGKRFGSHLGALKGGLVVWAVFGSVFGSKNEPREVPEPSKIIEKPLKKQGFLRFRGFRPRAQKRAKTEPPGRPKWSPNWLPEPVGRVKTRWEILPEAPRKFTMNFFSAPEASGSDLGALREGKIRISCCGPCFVRFRGAILEPFWLEFGFILEGFLERF